VNRRGAEGNDAAGLDVGGTFLKAARIGEDGRRGARVEQPVRKQTRDELLGQMAAAVRLLEAEGPVAAVGVGLPGIVDATDRRLRRAPNVPVLSGVDVGGELERLTGRPCFAENDANAAALAEAWIGAGRGSERLLFVTLGTGVGGGLVFGGRIRGGTSGYAGEIGHIQVDPEGVPCGCGSWGCLETIAGIPGWERRAREALLGGDSTLRTAAVLDPAAIVAAARSGDSLALELVEEAARAVGVGVAAALSLLNLDRVVLGGGVSRAGEFLLERVVEHTRRRTFPHVFADAAFRLAELGADAGVVGAARVALLGVAQATPALRN
jgi:glucokinase